MKRFFLASLMGMLIANLAFADTSIKSQIGTQDLNVDTDGAAHGTFQRRTSTGGTITLDKIDGNQIPWSNAYTRTIRPADIITKGPYVDVRSISTALTDVPIQTALSAIDNSIGADVFIPRGQYEIGTGLLMQGKSNVTIRGAGKDVTILHMNLGIATKPAVFNADGNWGILSIESDATFSAPIGKILIEDMTFWLDNTGTKGVFADDVANGTYWVKNVFFRGIQDITFRNVKIRGSRWEALYSDGVPPNDAQVRVRVLASDFKDTQFDAFNLNSATAADVLVNGNFFDNTFVGIQSGGYRHVITKNIFRNPGSTGIVFNEAGYPYASARGRQSTIANNIIVGLGTGNATANIQGIHIVGGISAYTDNSTDTGILIANNQVLDSVQAAGAAGGVVAFKIAGNAKLVGNNVSGLTVGAGATGNNAAYQITSGAVSGVARQRVFLESNTLEDALGDTLTGTGSSPWWGGIHIAALDNSSIYLSGNKILGLGGADNRLSLYIPTATGSPFVSLSGDILNGPIYYPDKWEAPSVTYLNDTGQLNNIPLFGDSNGAIGNHYSANVMNKVFTDNSTTPAVTGSNIWSTANTGATTITNFTGAVGGQEITIVFTDNLTTVQNNANILLSGAANFVATPNDTLRLLFFPTIGWREIGRSVN